MMKLLIIEVLLVISFPAY
ncbi:TPA: type I toxin-antitoxin system Ibs family toxin [Escherichia coli]